MYTLHKVRSLLFVALLALPMSAGAYQIDKVDVTPGTNDFVVGSGKVELTLGPGDTKVANITVTNRLGEARDFVIETEDFTGSDNPQETVVLLGKDKGPNSLKDYLSVSEKTFRLENGEKATIPVRVSVPFTAQPGGLYGSVVVSAMPSPSADKNNPGSTEGKSAIITRIGSLFFVTIPGETKKEGSLKEFGLVGAGNFITSSGPLTFRMLFENTGNMYLKPAGTIALTNILGQEVSAIEVDPWFSMPHSIRSREVTAPRTFMFGHYTARATISRGYGTAVDEKTISFWVVPVKEVGIVLVGILLIVLFVKWVLSHFEISRKGTTPPPAPQQNVETK